MKIILKSFLISILFLYSLLIFLPKENLYYFLLEKLKAENVEIVNSAIKDKHISLNIYDTNVKYKKTDVATVKNIEVKSLLFQTNIDIKDIKIQKSLKKFFPYDMEYIRIEHNILNPLVIDIELSKQFKIKDENIMKYLTKTENGYRYEYQF